MKKNKKKVQAELHHRRPIFLGGLDVPSNTSLVESVPHRHYHAMFGNLNAYQIAAKINGYFCPRGKVVECHFFNGHEVKKSGNSDSKVFQKLDYSWENFFPQSGMTFEEKISWINNVWLDPSYKLKIVKV